MTDNMPKLLQQLPGSEQSEQECVDVLLKDCPAEVALTVQRPTIERLIRTAFRSGWMLALLPGSAS